MYNNVFPTFVFFDLGDTLIYLDSNNQRKRYADTLDALQILHERGYRLGLLSDQPSGTTVQQVYVQLEGLGLAAYIENDLITISSEIPGNVRKPNKPIFDLALQKAGYSAASDQSIFVTETASHIQAARGYGWRAILKRNTGVCQPADGECVVNLSELLSLLPPLADIADTNLDLAPPAKLVDNLWAVPIDIQRITAKLTFDGQNSSGTGDAMVEFTMGCQAGNPIFDLRQTITQAWLDGASLPVTELTYHDFGGGPDAELRVIKKVLAAGSKHTVRLTYTLGTPQSSTAGSYQPAMIWSSGPRLVFNFGFTDLGAGRYLEAWVPANLIYDQLELVLELQIVNSGVDHAVITNGEVTTLGTNHWRVNFPERFTAFSPLVELRARDTIVYLSDQGPLSSGAQVNIEAWKLSNNSISLQPQINSIKNCLAENEAIGPYMHGNRFISFFHVGGMEYEGGTTTAPSALRHETFHSWWARGLKPASQPDAWFDEAWTIYNDHGASESQAFSFTDPTVTLCPRNPWIRVTAAGAYSNGHRFWKGVAASVGVSTLRALMSEFYKQRRHRPVTTTDIEEFLICRTGNSSLVDAFHRFVYGFDDPASTPDLWLRDDPTDPGAGIWSGRFWDSPDLWVRNSDDGGITHQSPEYGQDNWFYARVHNRGSVAVRHFVVTFSVKSFAGMQFIFPTDFLPSAAVTSGFDLTPGASVIVKARWPKNLVPQAGVHACLLAAVLTRGDYPAVSGHVWEHNNLAQKNLTIVDLTPDSWIVIPLVVTNLQFLSTRTFALELIRPMEHVHLEASLMHRVRSVFKRVPSRTLQPYEHISSPAITDLNMQLDCGGYVSSHADEGGTDTGKLLTSADPELLAEVFDRGVEAFFPSGPVSQIPILLRQQDQLTFGLRLKVPREAKGGDTLRLDLVQRDMRTKRVLGGIAVQVNVL